MRCALLVRLMATPTPVASPADAADAADAAEDAELAAQVLTARGVLADAKEMTGIASLQQDFEELTDEQLDAAQLELERDADRASGASHAAALFDAAMGLQQPAEPQSTTVELLVKRRSNGRLPFIVGTDNCVQSVYDDDCCGLVAGDCVIAIDGVAVSLSYTAHAHICRVRARSRESTASSCARVGI